MARREILNAILQSFKKLGGNTNEVLGTKTNVSFLGKGKSPELMLDMDINQEALGVLPRSKAVEELTNSVGYAVSGKLNDIQANQLLKNMKTMENVYFPPAAPANITDMVTGTKGLDKEGLESLRFMADDLPPPGSRGGAEDIAAPIASDARAFTGEGLEQIKNVKNNNLIVDDIVNKIYLNAGVAENAQPVVRANAREFLNRIKDLEDPDFPGGTTLSGVMNQDDFRFMTEGGGGGMGDPFLLVQKYFGPKVAAAVARLDGADDIQKFAENLVKVKDARGNTITSRYFDPESVSPDDFEFAEGGRVPMFAGGAARMGYQALAKYGIKPKDISRLFASLGTDKSLVGKEKTEYFRMLHKVLRNPDDFPDEISDIQKQLGIDVPGLKGGGLAGILEV
jgi:hypothetical protein